MRIFAVSVDVKEVLIGHSFTRVYVMEVFDLYMTIGKMIVHLFVLFYQ